MQAEGAIDHTQLGAGVRRAARWTLALLVSSALAGCAALPRAGNWPVSSAIAASPASTLGRLADALAPDAEATGLRLLPLGPLALEARLALVQRAQQSIDAQYYLIQNDPTGRRWLRVLRDAAARGVRVRLLVDDLYNAGNDALLAGLAATPNLELRLFNPFPAGRGGFLTRFIASAFHFDRVNRRMHNKLLVVDGAFAVTGGRNIADEYFAAHANANFVDLDVLVAGALLPRLQALFDEYWNSPVVFPFDAIVPPSASAAQRRQAFDALTAGDAVSDPADEPSRDVLGRGPIGPELEERRLALTWAPVAAYADPPARIKGLGATYALLPLEDVESVRYSVRDLMRGARQEVQVSSPYLIPGARGMALIAALRRRGVAVTVLTNSLAATDEPLVHLGYARYRVPMLELGVDLYELSPVRSRLTSRLGRLDPTQGRLHAKSAVIDRRHVFIGSMNFDPRSERHNTEMGLFIDSPALAAEVLLLMEIDRRQGAWRLRLAPDGGLRWIALDADYEEVVFDREPEVEGRSLFWLRLLAPLAPEELL